MLLAAAMVLGLVACAAPAATPATEAAPAATEAATTAAATEAATEAAPAEPAQTVWNTEGTMFPLAEPQTFKILASSYRYGDLEKIAESDDWKALEAATNVHIEWEKLGEYDEPECGTQLQMRAMSGDVGDAIWCMYLDNMTMADINDMAAAGLLIDLDPYMNDAKVMPNFNKVVMQEAPYLTQAMKNTDGKIHAFFGLSSTAAYTSCEGLLQVNKAMLEKWQAAKGVDYTPKTMDEFEDMLTFFKDNGVAVPYFIAQATYNGTSSLEPAFGMYGIGIKDSAPDKDIMIDDSGDCYFVYTTDAYKEAITKFADYYKKGLIWNEIFTGNDETITSVIANAATDIGVINSCYDIEGFVEMLPPVAEGYKPAYHTHPAVRNGIEGTPWGVITSNCKNPDVLCAFFDLFYQFENSLTARYGSKAWNDGEIVTGADGKYVFNVPGEPDKNEADATKAVYCYIACPLCWTPTTVETYTDVASLLGDRSCVRGNVLYTENNIWNKTENLWPRCSIVAEDNDEFTLKYTDISAAVAEYRAKFLTGELDIASNWDAFQQKLKDLGVERAEEIVQKSYDVYMGK